MAKKKADAAEEGGGEQAAEQPKTKQKAEMISAVKLKRLMAAKRSTTKDMHELMGTLAQQIKDASEHENLHRKAFGVVTMADKMEPEKLADFFDHLDFYRDISGLNKRAASVMKMKLGEKDDREEADDSDGEETEQESNVAKFPATAGSA